MDILHIHRYLANETSEKEERELEQWLKESDENRKQFGQIRKIYEVEIKHSDDFDAQAALSKFKRVMDEDLPGVSHMRIRTDPARYTRRKRKSAWVKSAAALVIGISLSLYAAISFTDIFDMEQDEIVVESASPTLIETSPGEQKSFRLKDGSRIQLNASSSVHIPADFGEN